jgi:hypothetical protein
MVFTIVFRQLNIKTTFACFRAAAHQLRQDKHQDMRQKKKKSDIIMTQTGVRRFS